MSHGKTRLGFSITFVLLFAWPAIGQAQLSSYGNTIVFKNPEIRNVGLLPVSPDTGKPTENAVPIHATISPRGELAVRDARNGLIPDEFEVALRPGRYLIERGFLVFPVYLEYDGNKVSFSEVPFAFKPPESELGAEGSGGADSETDDDGAGDPESSLPVDTDMRFDVDAYLAELDRIIHEGNLSMVCEKCRVAVEGEYARIKQWREERNVRADKVDRLKAGIDALSRSIKNTGDPEGTLRGERKRTERRLLDAQHLLDEVDEEIAGAMLVVFRCLRRYCQLPAIPAASLDNFTLYDPYDLLNQVKTEGLFYHYFVSTDCELCQATAREINEWIVRSVDLLADLRSQESFNDKLRKKREELKSCARALCVEPRDSLDSLETDATSPVDESVPSVGLDTEGRDEAEDSQPPAAEEEPVKVGARPMSVDETGFYASREPGFDIQAGAELVHFGDLEHNVGRSSMEAIDLFGVPESAVKSRADDQTVGWAVEIGHSWEYKGGLIRAALIYQDLSAMSGEVNVDLGNGGTARSAGQSDVEVYGISLDRVNFFKTSAVDGIMSYTVGGGMKRAERDDTAVTTISRNGVELQRSVIAESDSDTTWFLRIGGNYYVSPGNAFSLTLDASGGFFQSDSSMTSILLMYKHEL